MPHNLPIRSPFRNAFALLLLLAFLGLSTGCNTLSIGGPPSPSVSLLKGMVSLFTLPTAGSDPGAITAGPGGNVWFTEVSATSNGPGSRIVRITSTGTISEFPPSALSGNLGSITFGPDGNLWFTDGGFSQGGKIGRITPTGRIQEFPLPASNSDPISITVGPDGNLWFTDGNPGQIAKIERITPKGARREFLLPSSDSPGSITAGPDGALWFIERIIGPKTVNDPGPVGQIGRITLSGAISTYKLPSGSLADNITSGPDHNLWFTEEVLSSNGPSIYKIGRISPTGTITEFPLPTGNSNGVRGLPLGITVGSDGALWFTDAVNNAIGRITTGGMISEFILSAPQSGPENITSTPDGKLWFTEPGVNGQTGKIGSLTLT
jgi:streptogramin lyase